MASFLVKLAGYGFGIWIFQYMQIAVLVIN